MKRRTRNYAKRQLTWMRRMPGVELIDRTGATNGAKLLMILIFSCCSSGIRWKTESTSETERALGEEGAVEQQPADPPMDRVILHAAPAAAIFEDDRSAVVDAGCSLAQVVDKHRNVRVQHRAAYQRAVPIEHLLDVVPREPASIKIESRDAAKSALAGAPPECGHTPDVSDERIELTPRPAAHLSRRRIAVARCVQPHILKPSQQASEGGIRLLRVLGEHRRAANLDERRLQQRQDQQKCRQMPKPLRHAATITSIHKREASPIHI